MDLVARGELNFSAIFKVRFCARVAVHRALVLNLEVRHASAKSCRDTFYVVCVFLYVDTLRNDAHTSVRCDVA